MLEVGKKYRNRKGEEVTIESEEYGFFRSGKHLYYANGRYLEFESEYDLIEEVKEKLPFEMVVGGVYEDRDGREEEIVLFNQGSPTPFVGRSGRTYTRKGGFYIVQKSSLDLIKRIR